MANTVPSAVMRALAIKVAQTVREEAGILAGINKDWENLPAQQNESVVVGLTPRLGTAATVTPAAVPTIPSDTALRQITVSLSAWKKKDFYLTSREISQLFTAINWRNAYMEEAVKSVCDIIRTAVYAAAKATFWGYVKGTTGTSFFHATDKLSNLVNAKTELDKLLCPQRGRVAVFDTATIGDALKLPETYTASITGQGPANPAYRDAAIGRCMGLDILQELATDIPATHTAGTDNAAYVLNGAHAAGATSIVVKTGANTILAGDIIGITSGGVERRYAVKTGIAAAGTLTIEEPGLVVAGTDGDTVITKDHGSTHTIQGYAFHPDALILAGRIPDLDDAGQHQVVRDPVSGLLVVLSSYGGYHCKMFEVSALYGCGVVDPRKGARLVV